MHGNLRRAFYDQRVIELRGREVELATLVHAAATAALGSGRVVVIEGDAGIGKSSLIEAALHHPRTSSGVEAHYGCADELDLSRPFGLLFQALAISPRSPDPQRQRIAALAATIGPSSAGMIDGAPGERFLVQDALIELIDDLCAARPLLIALDDLQWADTGSLAILSNLVRRLHDLPIALVLALRPWPRRADLTSLVERSSAAGGHLMRLDALSPAAVGQLVDDVVGATPGPLLQRMLASAAGNPFFLRELLMSAESTGRLHVSGQTIELEGGDAPAPLEERILRRIAGLPDDATEMLRALAVVGGSVDARDLIDLVGRPAVPLLRTASMLQHAGLLQDREGLLSFQHDLVREAVRNDVPASARAAVHAQMAQILIARRADPLDIAPHIAAGATVGDVRATDWLRRAAHQLAPSDPLAAADLFVRAAELSANDVDATAGLLAEAVKGLAWAGRFDDAAALAERGLELHPSTPYDRSLRVGLAEVQFLAGRVSDAVGPLRSAAAEPTLDDDTRANLWAEAATASLWSLDLAGCERDATQAIAAAEACDSPNALARALGVLSRRMNLAGRIAESRDLGRRCLEVAGDRPVAQRATPHLYAGMSLWPIDPIESAAIFREGFRRAEHLGIGWALPVYLQAMVSADFDSGDWDSCITHYDTATVLLQDMGDLDELSMEALVGVARFFRNEIPASRRSLARMLEAASHPQARVGGLIYIHWLEALMAAHDGDPRAGAELLIGAGEICEAVEAPHVQLPFIVDAVRWGLHTDLHERALDRARSADELAALGGMRIHRAIALRCQAAVTDDPALAVAAVDELRPTNHRLDMVLACAQAAEQLQTAGAAPEARAHAEEGLALADTMGAVLITRRLQALLRAAGGGRGVRGPRSRPTTGWDSLTDTERQVVQLVAESLTNAQVAERLYISRRTVETHLVHVYGKLGLTSRRALIEAAT